MTGASIDEIHKPHPTVVRQGHLAEKIVIVDGQGGCGKTMLSPIIASLDRVELLTYAFEIEFICRLSDFNKISEDAAIAMVRMLTDHKLYQTMMGRETNFRFSDLSSVFQDSNPWRYFMRIFQEGDRAVPDRIQKERPILLLTTHDLLSVSQAVLKGLSNRVVLVELVRHPLYMIKQQQVNMETLLEDPRDISIYFEHKNIQLPYFAYSWEDKFLDANSMEKAIYTIEHMTKTNELQRKQWKEHLPENIVTVPFERYVLDPWPYMKRFEKVFFSKMTRRTEKMMKKQKVPRSIIADGSDNFQTRYLINDAAYLAGKPLVSASIFRFQGQLTVFDPHNGGPCYRCLYAEPPPAALVPS